MSPHFRSIQNVALTPGFRADILIAGVTGEPRGWDVHLRFGGNCERRWLIVQGSPDLDSRMLNAEAKARDSSAVLLTADSVGEHLSAWLAEAPEECKSILIDVSCMSRPAMGRVFAALLFASRTQKLTVTVAYVIAAYTPPPEYLPPNEDISPINEAFAGWPSEPAAATTLIMGVGYEQYKAEGAREYFDPSDGWIFVPTSPIKEYDEAVLQNNTGVIQAASQQHRLCTYSVIDPTKTFEQMASVVSGLIGRSNPVILPFGPKVFFALSLIVASIYKEVGVWHVTGDLMGSAPNYSASSHLVAFQLEFSPAKLSP